MRFQAVTGNPARHRFAAIAAPIVPSPTNAMRSTRSSSCETPRAYPSPACAARLWRRAWARTIGRMEWLGLNRRRLGTGMVVFGLAGVLMAGIVAVALILGAVAARDLDTRLEADQARIAASLTRLSVTMESLATTTGNAGATLETSSAAMADARDVLDAAAGSTVALAEALDISIFGSQPFAQASERLQNLALSISTFQGKAESLAINLHQNAADADVMTGQIRKLKDQVTELASRIAGFDRDRRDREPGAGRRSCWRAC